MKKRNKKPTPLSSYSSHHQSNKEGVTIITPSAPNYMPNVNSPSHSRHNNKYNNNSSSSTTTNDSSYTTSITSSPLAAAKHAQNFPWNHRPRPQVFDPIHIRLGKESPPAKACSCCLDWWNSRSTFLCCLYPLLRRWSHHSSIMDMKSEKILGVKEDERGNNDKVVHNDDDDNEIIAMWKKQIVNHPLNSNCPESMRGLWWLQWDHAPENLVTIFSDCEWIGIWDDGHDDDHDENVQHNDDDNNNDDDDDDNVPNCHLKGYGMWSRRLKYNWSRDDSFLGLIFAIWAANRSESRFWGRMNLKDGICTIHGKRGEGIQVVYRVTDEEWWKVHYSGNPGEPNDQTIEYMYKWLKVLDKDGNPTQHWNTYKQWTEEPLPHPGCGCGNYQSWWWPLWACFLSKSQVNENMCRPHYRQLVNFRV